MSTHHGSFPPGEPQGVGFYGGPFSNFALSPLTMEPRPGWAPVMYETVEHRFQAMKTTDPAEHMRIAAAGSPKAAKALGRRASLRADWEEVKFDIMVEALRQKFSVYNDFRRILIDTGHNYLYERSPYDAVWGAFDPVTKTWTGQNLLGVGLMVVRAELMA